MARCGCRGERSCLVCEEEASPPTVRPDYQLYQCVNCGELLQSEPADYPDRPLVTCPAPCGHAHVLTVPDHVTLGTTSVEFGSISVVKEFVHGEEETALVQHMDSWPWAQSQSGRRKQDYGPKVNFKRQKVKLGHFSGLPGYSRALVDRLTTSLPSLADFHPVELCNLEYCPTRGSSIAPHQDDAWVWGERLVTVNLLSSTFLTFSLPQHSLAVHIPLPRRSVVVVRGCVRHTWLHSIWREHIVARRVAITLRELGEEFLPSGSEEAVGEQLLRTAMTFHGQPTNITTKSS